MKTTTHLAILVSVLLSACGGGGGGASGGGNTSPVTQTCANGGTDYPTCTAPVTPAKLQTTVPNPPYALDSQEFKAFAYINDFRKSLGLGLLAYSPELTKSAVNHANYLAINKTGGFDEDATKPGFTGRTTTDRANFAGYATNFFVGGGLAVANTAPGAVQSLINTIYHRSTLMAQDWVDVGLATYIDTAINVNFGKKDAIGQRNASDFVSFYPLDGQSNINLSMSGEIPNPFPEFPDGLVLGKVGYPISFVLQADQTIGVKEFSLKDMTTGELLNSYIYTQTNDPNKLIQKNEAWLVAKTQLKPTTKYQVVFKGTANGVDFSCVNGKLALNKSDGCAWVFTTADRLLPSF